MTGEGAGQLAHDDTGGPGRLVVMLPGAGDVRSEYRLMVSPLAAAGLRVVTADLPGHGESAPSSEYTVASTASALTDLIGALGAGPAVVVACSFAPAAAVWAAAERPGLIDGLVAISPHFEADRSLKGRLGGLVVKGLLRGPWAGGLWAKLYAGWYKTSPPSDLADEIATLKVMLSDPRRRRAVRETLTANREGVAERMERLDLPTLTVFGSADDHFADPVEEAERTAAQLGGRALVIEGAGHYPHVEAPAAVAAAVAEFVESLG